MAQVEEICIKVEKIKAEEVAKAVAKTT